MADSTLQPPPTDDGTLASQTIDDAVTAEDAARFEIGEPGDEEAPPDLQAAGVSLPDPEELKVDRSPYEGCCKMWAWIIFAFVCLISLTVGLIVGINKEEGKSSSSLSRGNVFVPVTRDDVRAAMQSYIVDSGVSGGNDFVNPNSPQSVALNFLANEDPLQMNAPLSGLTSDEGYEFITRYVMTVFHASLGGDTWNYDLLFKSKHETCEWYDVFQPPVGQVGVLCNKDSNKIVGLSFSKCFRARSELDLS